MKIPSFLKFYFAGLIALFIVINACSMKKRVYRHGYNIEWNNWLKNPDKRELTSHLHTRQATPVEISNPLTGEVTASVSSKNEANPYSIPTYTDNKKTQIFIEGCDTIIFKNGLKIKARILEIGTNEIRYKMCDNQDGPTFIKSIGDILNIHYANGSITELSPSSSPAPSSSNNTGIGGTSQNQGQQNQTVTTSNGTSGKSQLIALLLCGFLGFLGIHRFYLGHIGIGILMLLTGGCCGILWIVDFIRIITGDLTPKDGGYSERL